MITPFIQESTPKLLGKDDISIMDNIVNITNNKTLLIQLYRVQLYLGVYSIAEIPTADGLEIIRDT